MPIQFKISNKVAFKVKGQINGPDGAAQFFDFGLTAKRLNADQLRATLEVGNQQLVSDFLAENIIDWRGVKDEAGADMPFSLADFDELQRVYPGLSGLIFNTYLAEVAARAKN